MSDKVDKKLHSVRLRAEQGARIATVREALGLSGEKFAKRVNDTAARFGRADVRLTKSKLSETESGDRHLRIEEAAAILELDPERRSVQWLVFGEKRAAQVIPSKPRPAPTRDASRDAK